MDVDGLALPERLVELIESDQWPCDTEESVPGARIADMAPGGRYIHLERPPFLTIAGFIAKDGDLFWLHEMAAPTELDPALAVVIVDFGLGADAPIVLDYRESQATPCVRRLEWTKAGREEDGRRRYANHWVVMASTFDEFASGLSL